MTSNTPGEHDLAHWLVDYLVTNIGCDPEDIDPDRPLNELGLGSRDSVVLSGELSELLGRTISPVDFWQHPTINAMAQFLTAPEPDAGAEVVPAETGCGAPDEPIAVIGLGCRFPGDISGPDALWQFLCDGQSAVGEVPPDRWPPFVDGRPESAAALSKTTRWGAFLNQVDAFDAEFFEISPSEANRIDPQQRLVLEVAYEALEHAGIPAGSLRRTLTGVFAGACLGEYGFLASKDLCQVDAWTGTGGALSIIANRLSYFLDVRGPSVVVDTACSSSLVAIHLACQSLRAGESSLAIAAGVNLLLSPAVTRSFDQADAMSPTGSCHAFDATADGFVRGEGCGVVVLKRLSDARRDGDRVLAVVRGSAVNQDGRSNGLMAPNPAAQIAVLRAACANAGILPREVDYVEAHGTGTLLGDPIEARALGTVYGRGRPADAPVLLGALKTNLGHMEAAAGVAGFIKAVLAVNRGWIPANRNFETPNPHINFHDMRLKVVAAQHEWVTSGGPRRAGVSSFGFGGTNAHVVLEQAPTPAPAAVRPMVVSPVSTLVVSGKSEARVSALASVLADWMVGPGAGVPLVDVAHTLNHHRTLHGRFATVCAADRAQAVSGLRTLAAGQSGAGVVAPHNGPCGPGTVFVYSGQGSQWLGMGRQLLADEPAFAAAVAKLDSDFVAQVGFSLWDVVAHGKPVSGIEQVQPVLVGVQLALTSLWRSYGVEPDAVIGHSMGEVSAAVVAGVLTAAEGLAVIATRSALMARLSGQGAMALLELDAQATEALIAGYPQVTIAVYASPRQTVIAGPPDLVDRLVEQVAGQDRLARRIDVDVASHHPTIDPILVELRSALSGLTPQQPMIPILSTVEGAGAAPAFDADHWVANLRNPVRFSEAVHTAGAEHATFVEVSPHPLLTHAISESLADRHHHSVGTLLRDAHDTITFHTNLNSTHTTHPPNTEHPAEPHPPLPATPWHHTHHWITTTTAEHVVGQGSAPRPGTLLGEHVTVPAATPAHLWLARLTAEAKPYPGRHRLHGVEVVPASVLLQTLLTVAAELGAVALSDVRFEHPIMVDGTRIIQVFADHEAVAIASSAAADAPADRWTRHVSAQFSASETAGRQEHPSTGQPHQAASHTEETIAELLAVRGVEGQPYPWTIDRYTPTGTGVDAHVALPGEAAEQPRAALLDAAMHIAPLAGADDARLYVPAAIGEIQVGARTGLDGSVSVRRTGGDSDELVLDVDVDGLTLRSLRCVALERSAPRPAISADPTTYAHTIEWRPRLTQAGAQPVPGEPGTVAVTGGAPGVPGITQELWQRFERAGHRHGEIADARYVVYVADSIDTEQTDTEAATRMSTEVSDLVRQLAERADREPVRLWILTTGVHQAAGPAAVRQSPLWGLAGVIAAEHPEIWGGLVDVDADHDVGDTAMVLAATLDTPSRSVLVLRDGVLHAPELASVTGAPIRESLRCRPDAAYLITGGLGALGLKMAGWLTDRGARRLLLAARTPLPPRREWDGIIAEPTVRQRITAIRELEDRGVSVELVSLDIGSSADVQALLARRDRDGAPPIRGVIHAAGVTRDELLTSATEAATRDVLWPKIGGAQALHEAFPCGSVDFLFLTASAAGIFGVPGQASYAAGNAYLDALARARHRRGCHTVSLDWTAWEGLGFAADAQIVAQELARRGSRPLTPDEAFGAWDHVHRHDLAQAVVIPLSSSAGDDPGSASGGQQATSTATAWSQMSTVELQDVLTDKIRVIIARELRTAGSELETDRPFLELGLNSMMALSIRRDIEQLVGIELSASMLWNHPTVATLAAHLCTKLRPPADAGVAVTAVPADDKDNALDSFTSDQQRAALSGEFDKAARIAGAEPVAVVGIGCRFPGDVVGPDSYWRLLIDGTDAVTEIPSDRWDAEAFYDPDPLTPGRMTTKCGGFVSDVARFDAEFFGITPREAQAMDPQQRMLLEVAWEAIEHAGIAPDSLAGTKTGVMMGVYYNEYQSLSAQQPEMVSAYTGTGNAHSVTVGRIAYLLGLRGPAVAVDTACSSSLVALHLACQSLRLRETDVALAGGVNVILRPETQIAISAWGLLSAEGRCKTFDASADGFVRGEGCGVVVLKRLVDAMRDGDQVLAVVRGSAINQDGRSNGVTAPNALAQRDVITDALRAGDVAASSVAYIESHGTATIVGDPIEFEALADTYGKSADGQHDLCALGSSKTNFGHLEAAAGIAGFIKATLAVQRDRIPPNLHFSQWNPAIDPAPTRFFVPTEPTSWPAGDGPRRAAVSSFGFGGTNAHVVIEQGPDQAVQPRRAEPTAVSTLVVSGKTRARIAALAGTLAEWMHGAGAEVPLADVAHTLNHHRAQHSSFATVCAADRDQAVAGLQALAVGQSAPGVVTPHEGQCGPGTVFVFSGQGSQWPGMACRLMADEPVFADTIAELEPAFVAELGFSLQSVLAGSEPVDGSVRVQSVLLGTQLALTALWRSYGVEPDAVIGHSMGEITAAVVAGALSAADGLRVIAARSRLMATLAGQGAVALVELGTDATEALIADYPNVHVTVYSSPRQTVISGPTDEIETIISAARQQNTFARRVNMEVASHHPMMDPILAELRAALADLTPGRARIPVITTTFENGSAATVFDADHWVANLRNPVRFQQAIAAAGADHTTFIEISPHPVLTKAISDTLADGPEPTHHHCLGTLERDTHDTVTFHTNLNATHTSRPPNTDHPAEPRAALPTTPWQHSRFWVDVAPAALRGTAPVVSQVPPEPAGETENGVPVDWLYEPTWQARPLAAVDTTGDDRWLVLADQQLFAELGRALGSRACRLAPSAMDTEEDRTVLHDAVQTVDYVLYAPPAESAPLDIAAAYRNFGALRRLAAVLAAAPNRPRLLIVTRNAQPVAEEDRANPAHAVLWGLGRTIALEHPEIWRGMVDLDEAVPADLTAQYVLSEAATADGEDQVAYRAGVRQVPRLQRHVPAPDSRTLLAGHTSHLVIGGTGNLGPHLITQLADMGAATIVAVSRNPGTRLHDLARRLASRGTTLIEVAADAADEAAMTALFDRFGTELPPLEGIYLAAFAGGPVTLQDMTDDDVNVMFRPKLDVVGLLHTLSLSMQVRQFVLFSSISGLLGSRWLGHYTATSTYLDTFAYARRALGLPATVVNWGVWKSLADIQSDARQVTSDSGLEPMADEVAIRALALAMSPVAPVRTTVVDADWQKLAAAYRTRAAMRIVDDLLSGAGDDAATTSDTEFRAALRDCPPRRRREMLVDHVDTLASTVMGLAPSDVLDRSAGFFQLGMDSLMVVTLQRSLSETLGEALTPAVVFDYPTVEGLTDHLATLLPEMTEIQEAQQLSEAPPEITEEAGTELIAVVGMACRLPGGVDNPEQYWELLKDGRSGIVRVPPERWDAEEYYTDDHTVPGTICNREGGFLTSWEPDEFDAEFFSISPREAAAMDPQQRLLLEVACEALEDAGITPQQIRNTQTSVYVGLTAYDYMLELSAGLRPEDLDAYIPTGNAANFAAGRLSYFLGARGPAVVVDTACSSSLVALHLACQSLRLRESDAALVGGTNLLLSPGTSIACSRWGMLSPDGQCKTFDAGADGYVRSEGCGVVVLKRLSDAQRDGDRVLAVVRGSAVNQDGASSGVTVPNGPAQQALLRQALSASNLKPADIDYVEAHGTGTPLGDPIELEALHQVFSDRGESPPLVLGAVKTNLGHLEAAAGVAGFIKTVLALQHGYIPKHLNFEQLTPFAAEAAATVSIASEGRSWPGAADRPRRAGVSSFGVSGTNAHVVLEQAPVRVPVPTPMPEGDAQSPVSTLVVSGKTVERVASLAAVLADWTQGQGAQVPLADIAHTLNHHRTSHPRFATLCARGHDDAAAGLRALAAGRPAVGLVAPHDGPCGPGTVFVYSGQGSQWAGMGLQLLVDEPAFATAVAELDPVFTTEVGFSLRDVLADGAPVTGIERIQPVLVGMQLALTALWRSYGVEPDAVIGHSMGEVTAAVVAGVLTADEGLRVIATRSRLMARLSGQGAMALLELDAEATEVLIAGYRQVTVAVYASPRQTVIAGPPDQVDAVIAVVSAQDRLARRVEVDVASHHPIIDPVLPELRSALADLAPRTPTMPILSTVDGAGPAPRFDADHWAANLRRPVRFREAVAAAGASAATFVEVSPHPLLTHAITDTMSENHHHSIPTLQRDTDDTVTFHTNLNATHVSYPPPTEHGPEPHPALPETPWHHTRHWITPTAPATPQGVHPLLGSGVTDPTNGIRVWESTLGPDVLWLGDHRVDEACVLPGAAYAELALAAVTDVFGADGDEPWGIRELNLDQVMHVVDGTVVVTTLTGNEAQPRVEIRSRRTPSDWTTHASATLGRTAQPPVVVGGVDDQAATELEPDELYRRLRSAGQQHGPAFQGIVGLTVFDSGSASAAVRLPAQAKPGSRRFLLHPVMLDVALQSLGATRIATDLAASETDRPAVVLPIRLAGVRVYGDITEGVIARGALHATARQDRFVGQVVLTAADGRVVLEIDEVEMALLAAPGPADELTNRLFALEWEPVALDKPPGALAAMLLIGVGPQTDPFLAAVRSGLSENVAHCETVTAGGPGLGALTREALTRKDISWDGIALVCPPRSDDEALTDVEQLELARSRTLLLADIVKTVSQIGARNSPRLWIVTRGGQQIASTDSVTLAQAGFRGIARVLTFEHPELRTTVVDVDALGTGSAAALATELLADADHDEVALRDGQRYVNRLVPAATGPVGTLAVEPRHTVVDLDRGGAVRLQIAQPGRLDALTLHAVNRTPPAVGQVEVRVVAAGVNFSDVLKTMGVYPGLNGSAPVIGGECVGVVTAVGPGVDSVGIGQRVIAFGPGTFGSHLTTLADLVIAVPDGLPDLEAATFGIAYLTAWHSLCEVGRLAPGERVLIHSATGGVGLAAVSIANMIGAQIYATAGSESKREMLSRMGVEYVGDSRTVDFAEEILAATDGHGVDVVLNSLSGDAIRRGVEILAAGGRFIELGKKDVYADASLGMAALAKSGTFAVVDLDLNLRLQPARYRKLLAEILDHVRDGGLEVLPVTEFQLGDAVEGFRLMASGGHTGKVVISIPTGGAIDAVASPPPQPPVRSDGGYIVVGGMGGLGFVFTEWLVANGAGMVVLNGRSAPSDDIADAIEELRASGARIEVVTGDIAEPDTAARLIAAVYDAGLRPAGVLHSATVLADEIVINISESAATRVFAPKVAGSWWLHEATADLDLDWWLTFSSAASLLGSPGQGAYAAANAWVDGLVGYRRARGLPAIGINWGPWAEVGRAQFFADLGFSMITADQGMAAMQRVLAADRARTGVFSLDARQWFQSFPAAETSSLFAKLGESTNVERRGGGKVRAELDAAEPRERPARLAAAIADEICAVLRSSDPLDHEEAMESLGLDSLMALELRNRLESSLGITLPVALVWAYPTISGLAGALCGRMGYEPADDGAAAGEPESEPELSDEEMDLLADLVDASELEATTGATES